MEYALKGGKHWNNVDQHYTLHRNQGFRYDGLVKICGVGDIIVHIVIKS